jgi:hypothetical protein
MTSQTVVSGVTFSNSISKTLPAIPGLMSLAFFGTAGDGLNGNRVPGGPVISAGGTAPVVSSGFVTAGSLGTNATLTLTMSGGTITGVTPVLPGTMYTSAPTVILTTAGTGGTGTVITATVAGGVVTGYTIVSGGTGYTSTPTAGCMGGNNSALDVGIPRTSGLVASGWTWGAIARTSNLNGITSQVMGDTQLAGAQYGGSGAMLFTGSTNKLTFFVALSTATLTLPSALSAWRFIAGTYSGGMAGFPSVYSLSDNLVNAGVAAASVGLGASQRLYVGPGPVLTSSTEDVAAFFATSGALTQSQLQGLYGPLQAIMARRGIAVL